jgi:hypothetical protein
MERINITKINPKFIEWVKQQKAEAKIRHEEIFKYIAEHPELTEKLKAMNKAIRQR